MKIFLPTPDGSNSVAHDRLITDRLAWGAGIIAIVAALLTLVGWVLDVPRLTDWWGDDISMLPNTAVCCLLCGVALLVACRDVPRRGVALRIIGAVVGLVGGLTLLEHLTGVSLGIDTLLLTRDWGQQATTSAMRMGPPAASSFLLLGVATWSLAGGRVARRNAAALALLVMLIASLSLVGYLLGADQLYGVARFTGIARQTSLLLAILAMGVVATVPEAGIMAALRQRDTGGMTLRYLLPPLVLLPVVLGWLRVLGEDKELYDTAFGTSMLIVVQMTLLIALLWWASRAISQNTRRAENAKLRLASTVATTSDAVIGKTLDGTIESWNQGAVDLFGYQPSAAIGKNIRTLIPTNRQREEDDIQARLRRGEKIDSYETVRVRRDGSLVDISLTVSPILDSSGNIIGASSVARDISHRIRADRALQRSEEELLALANCIPQLAWMARPDGHIFWYNQQWYDFTGTTLEDMEGWGWQSVHDPEFLPQVVERWTRCLEEGEPFEMEFPLRRADGELRWFLTRCRPLRDQEGNVLRWFGTNTDVDEVKLKELALEQKTQTLELLNHAGRTLGGQLELEELLQSVTDLATQLSEASFGAFFYNTTDGDGQALLLYTLSGADREAFANFGMPRATPLFGPTFEGRGIVRSDDITADPRYGAMPPHYGMPEGHLAVRSYMAASVKSRMGVVLGGLFFGHPEPGKFSEATERVIEGIAAQAGVAIDNARLYENLKRAADEREELLEAERTARSEAERLNVMKDEFLATLSHELRTPLNAILGWAQILAMDSADENDLREGLDTIQRNARAQTELIEDLLDMSRIVSGKIRLAPDTVHVADVLLQAVDSVRPTADTKQISLTTHLPARTDTIRGDAVRLQQVFWNLLTNAIKFTPRGGSVRVSIQQEAEDVVVACEDSGIGIAEDLLPHVFERFRQADSSTTRAYGGLGLGLSIVKNLVELHGGSVEARSPGLHRGTTFVVRLPLKSTAAVAEADAELSLDGEAIPRPGSLAGLRVLVVDDEQDSRYVLERMLRECQAQVQMAASADEALEHIANAPPDLIVSDIGMPGMDGYELIDHIRRLSAEAGGAVPAVAVTAFARREDRDRALAAGYDAHLAKPVQPQDLAEALSGLMARG